MSDTTGSLLRQIRSAGDLQSVVRTMKALAASSIGQYEKSVRALAEYYRTVELGLGACFRESGPAAMMQKRKGKTTAETIGAIVFGSDQGLVGQFNDVVADYAIKTLAALPGSPQVWAVGERVQARLADAGLPIMGLFPVPNSVQAITPLVGQIQIESEAHRAKGEYARVYVFHNRPQSEALYEPVSQRLLPLDAAWVQQGLGQRFHVGPADAGRRSCAAATRHCVPSSANIFSFHSSERAPSPSRARTRAAWRRWNVPTKTSTNCWRISTAPSTACVRAASTRNFST